MLNAKAFAHAMTVVTAAFYVICLLLSSLFPDIIFNIAKSWIHSISLESIKITEMIPINMMIVGLISISALTWITTYLTVKLYNILNKK